MTDDARARIALAERLDKATAGESFNTASCAWCGAPRCVPMQHWELCPLQLLREAAAALRLPRVEAPQMADAAEMLWVVLANVSGGDWTQQSQEWQEAAARWRDNYFAAAGHAGAASPPEREEP